MMRSIMLLLMLFPCLAFAQATKEDYGIYSQYLKVYQARKEEKIYFVVNETTIYSQKNHLPDINSDVNDLIGNLRGDRTLISMSDFTFRDVIYKLTKDTLWIPVIAGLNKIDTNFKIENNFSPDLQTVVVSDQIYNKYFSHVKKDRQIVRSWARFHKEYPMPSELIELSKISSDGRRAVFYFSTRCGGLCGEGELVFFYKEDKEWKYWGHAPMWAN